MNAPRLHSQSSLAEALKAQAPHIVQVDFDALAETHGGQDQVLGALTEVFSKLSLGPAEYKAGHLQTFCEAIEIPVRQSPSFSKD